MADITQSSSVEPGEKASSVDYDDDPVICEYRTMDGSVYPIHWSLYMNIVDLFDGLASIEWTGLTTRFKAWKSLSRAIAGLSIKSRSDIPFMQYAGMSEVYNKRLVSDGRGYIDMHIDMEAHVANVVKKMKEGARQVNS